MNYLIISTYDCCYDWSVQTNNGICTRYNYVRGHRIEGLEKLLEEIDSDNLDIDNIDKSKYDFIVICQDGNIEFYMRKE